MRRRSAIAVLAAISVGSALGCARAADPPPEYPPLDATPPQVVPDPVLPAAGGERAAPPAAPAAPETATDAVAPASDAAPQSAPGRAQ